MTAAPNKTALPPAQPSYIFRGHAHPIHSVQIVRQNTRLITGDAEGWVVVWKLESKRPVAVWKAHDAAILGTEQWRSDRIITHGRDNALRIWQLGTQDEEHLSHVLPADALATHHPKPWLLHTLPVNTLNFCAFSMCHDLCTPGNSADQEDTSPSGPSDSILVAVPARDDKKIEVYRFPDEKLLHVVPKVQLKDTGMVMAVKLAHDEPSNNMILIAGYEGGFTAVHLLRPSSGPDFQPTTQSIQLARTIYLSQPHTQPVLSLDVSPDAKTYFTSSADAVIAAHRIPGLPLFVGGGENAASKMQETTVSPAQLSPADAQQHIPEARETSSAEVATTTSDPLTFPKSSILPPPSTSSGLSFAEQQLPSAPFPPATPSTTKPSGLSSLLSSVPAQSKAKSDVQSQPPQLTIQAPYKSIQTKHAGQQSLHVRSDGRLLVTGGWDSKVRLYSTKTLKEVAVLKWHKEGVYAAGFSSVLESVGEESPGAVAGQTESFASKENAGSANGTLVRRRDGGLNGLSGLSKLQKQREIAVQLKHWVVAGAKDGKVSLWEVF